MTVATTQRPDSPAAFYCDECGHPYSPDQVGVSRHVSKDGGIDHDVDADHVPYGEELVCTAGLRGSRKGSNERRR